ncbi:AAA family ATPase [Candidatus Darwinibacter acetoxidans]
MIAALSVALQAGVPILAWGPPGVGKTAVITALAESLALPLEVVLASIREPADFSGLPVIREDGVKMEAPAWARRLAREGKGILFLDEISTAPPAVQAALLRVVLDRVVGDLELPPGVAVVAAANPPEQAAGGWDLSPPLANRFCHLTWTLDSGAWIDGMIQGWPAPRFEALPEGWEKGIPASRSLVAAFIRHRPHLLLQVPGSEDQAGKAWPSPRSWEMAARLLAASSDDDVAAILVSGCVGDGAAMEFLTWRRDLDLPDPEAVLREPEKFTIPKRGDQAFAILTAVVTAAVGNLTRDRWLAAWTVLARAADQGAKDIAAAAAKALAQARKPNLPLPQKELAGFIPLLEMGGLL